MTGDRYRGRTTRQRNVAEKVAREWAERRAAAETSEQASWTSSGPRSRPRSSCSIPAARTPAEDEAPPAVATAARTRRSAAPDRSDRAGSSSRGAGRRVPDLSALPRPPPRHGRVRLASASASDRPASRPGCTASTSASRPCRTAPSRTSPRPSPSRPTRSGSAGSRATRRSATGWPRSWAPGWATRRWSRCWSRGPRSPTSAASWSPTRPPPGSPRSRAWRIGRREGPGGQRPGAVPGDARAGRPAGGHPDARAPARGSAWTPLLAELLRARLRAGARGRRPRRVRAPGRHRRRLPAVRAAAGPDRVVRRRDRLACAPSTPPTSAVSSPCATSPSCPRPSSCCRRAAPTRSGSASAGWADASPSGSPLDLERFAGDAATGAKVDRGSRAARRRCRGGLGAARRPDHRPRPPRPIDTCSSSTSPATSPTPPTSCGARPRSGTRSWSRPATCPRTGRPPTCRRATGRARLHGARTLELTWQSEAGDAEGMAFASKSLTIGRPVRLARAGPAAGPDGAPGRRRRALAGRASRGSCSRATSRRASRSCSPRPAIAVGHRPPDRGAAAARRDRPRRAQPQRRASRAAPTASPWSPTASCSARVRVRRPKAMRRVVPRDLLERLTPGDLVVHIDHGIARYEQMLRRGEAGPRSATTSSSRSPAGDRIFVPVEQINRVSRYAGGEHPHALAPRRHRLAADEAAGPQGGHRPRRGAARPVREARGGRGLRRTRPTRRGSRRWRRRSRTRRRPTSCGRPIEVKADMEARRPMDRLVVGDVGYGKTEVALRAAFKATQDGKQVAVLVPTTVLAAQHFQTFSQRFAAFPLTVRLLSRFVSAEGAGGDDRGPRGRDGRHRHRHAPAAVQGRRVQGPRAGRGRRGAALRRRAQGAAQAAADRGRRADAVAPRRSRARSTWRSPGSAT